MCVCIYRYFESIHLRDITHLCIVAKQIYGLGITTRKYFEGIHNHPLKISEEKTIRTKKQKPTGARTPKWH